MVMITHAGCPHHTLMAQFANVPELRGRERAHFGIVWSIWTASLSPFRLLHRRMINVFEIAMADDDVADEIDTLVAGYRALVHFNWFDQIECSHFHRFSIANETTDDVRSVDNLFAGWPARVCTCVANIEPILGGAETVRCAHISYKITCVRSLLI